MNADDDAAALLDAGSATSPFGAEGAQIVKSREPSEGSLGRSESVRQPGQQILTARALAVGLAVGSVLCCSNTYFGLQSGWVTMGSLQSAILGFGIFSILEKRMGTASLCVGENVIVQTTAVATATMPLAAGLVGVIPAFKLFDPPLVFGPWQLILWSLAMAFIGVFCAVPLRTQTIIKEQLKFPSGTATANIIRTLHAIPDGQLQTAMQSPQLRHSTLASLLEADEGGVQEVGLTTENAGMSGRVVGRVGSMRPSLRLHSARSLLKSDSIHRHASLDSKWTSMRVQEKDAESMDFPKAWRLLIVTFTLAGAYSLASNLWQPLKTFPVFTWIGLPMVTAWGWELSLSLGYVGQGFIIGPRTALSMLLGAVTGYGVLGPLARHLKWAPGEITDWETGATGWILWVSLAIMLADSISSLVILCSVSITSKFVWQRQGAREARADEAGREPGELPTWVWVAGLLATGVFCTAVLSPLLGMKVYEPIAAIVLALLVAVLAVRALGETDLNPVSGVGKLSQVVFALIAPRQVVANLAAGAIAEAGAQQAGDMMQDFKTAYLLGVCPRAQFIAMLIGSGASVFVSVGAYWLFTSTYDIPGPLFPTPTAEICVLPFCIAGAGFGAALPLLAALLEFQTKRLESSVGASCESNLKLVSAMRRYLPSGIAFSVGMYVQPRWTIPRVLGSLIEQFWLWQAPMSHGRHCLIVASGLILGEGTSSILAAALQASIFKSSR